MAKYTITIKTLIDNNFDFKLTEYPIFDENYRTTLNHNILYHFYENEIGFETPALFRLYLNQKLNEIMPYYNELYKAQAELLKNLTNNVNITESFQRKTDTNSNTQSSSSAQSKNVFQDTPQGELKNNDITNFTYATNMNLGGSNINDTTNLNGNATEDYIKTIIGNNGQKFNIEILKDITNNLLNIDTMILNDLEELFMMIY